MSASCNQIASMIIRGMAIYVFIIKLPLMSVYWGVLFTPGYPESTIAVTALADVLTITAAALMWIKAPQLGKFMAGKSGKETVPLDFKNLQTALLVAVGFLIISFSIKPAVSAIVSFGDNSKSNPHDIENMAMGVLYFFMGFLMIFSRHGIVKLIRHARES